MSDIMLMAAGQIRANDAVVRVMEEFNKSLTNKQKKILGTVFDEGLTKKGIREVYETEFLFVFMSGSKFEAQRQAAWAIKDTLDSVGIDSDTTDEGGSRGD